GRLQKRQLHSVALERLDLDEMRFPSAEYGLFAFDPTLSLRHDDDSPRGLSLFAVIWQDVLKQPTDDRELAGLDALRRIDDQYVLRLHSGVQHQRKLVRKRESAAARRTKRLLQI